MVNIIPFTLICLLSVLFIYIDKFKILERKLVQVLSWLLFCLLITYKIQLSSSLLLIFFLTVSTIKIFAGSIPLAGSIYFVIYAVLISLIEGTSNPIVLTSAIILIGLIHSIVCDSRLVLIKRRLIFSILTLLSVSMIVSSRSSALFQQIDLWIVLIPTVAILLYSFILQIEFASLDKNNNEESKVLSSFYYLTLSYLLTKLLVFCQESSPQITQALSTKILIAFSILMLLFKYFQIFHVHKTQDHEYWRITQAQFSLLAVPIIPLMSLLSDEMFYFWALFAMPAMSNFLIKREDKIEPNLNFYILNSITIAFLGFTPLAPQFWMFSNIIRTETVASESYLITSIIGLYVVVEFLRTIYEFKSIKFVFGVHSGRIFDLFSRAVIIGMMIFIYYGRLISE